MLELINLTRKYASRTAVDDVSITIVPGRTYALLGPNGSGKTTLMKMIAGLIKPTKGEITLDGNPLGAKSKAHIAYMPTENYFYNYMTVRDAGKYYADFFEDFNMIGYLDMLSRMELSPKDKIRQLSSGMSAKLRLALILNRSARIMMFDEPLNGVDILTRAQVIDAISAGRRSDCAMLISTHLVDELEDKIDYVIFLKNGAVARMGERRELCREDTLTGLYMKIYGHASGEGTTNAQASQV